MYQGLLSPRHHVTHFPCITLYHCQIVISACDKEAEAQKCLLTKMAQQGCGWTKSQRP